MAYLQKDIKCKDIDYGSYLCTYTIYLPWSCNFDANDAQAEPRCVAIDKCLLPEIISLWEMGIKTTGCCCGHGKHEACIGVEFDDIQKMKDLGYKVHHNPLRPDDEDSFVPKTKLEYGVSKAWQRGCVE